MKNKLLRIILPYLTTTFIILSYSYSAQVDWNDIEKKKGLFYEKSKDIPFSGQVSGLQAGKIIRGKKEGEFFKFYKNGNKLSRMFYKNNKLNGLSYEYYRNGNLLSKKNYLDNKLEGEYFDYYSFGQLLSRRFYVKGKLNGKYLSFYKNGQLKSKRNYKLGKLDGEYLIYHEYELEKIIQLKEKKNYKNGKLNGYYFQYHENGKIKSKSFHNLARLEGEFLKFDRLGKLIEKIIYLDGVFIRKIKF